jgi:ribosome maturation factor RimP
VARLLFWARGRRGPSDSESGLDLAQRVEELIGPTVDGLGYDVVRVILSGKQAPRLQIMAEAKSGKPMTVDDCAAISRAVSAVLEVEDPINSAYTLEVSSPGIDRPLVRLGDYSRFAGFEARVETIGPIDGRRKFSGRLLGTEGETVRMQVEDGDVALPFADIRRGKLVLTDELLKSSLAPKS